jgi:hypothetical protein
MSTTRRFTYAPRRSPGLTRTEALSLEWEAEGSSLPYDEGIHGSAAWDLWVRRFGATQVPIYWYVAPAWEHAPFIPLEYSHGDFLTYFTWPKDARGHRLR